ncbi:MAG: lipopolysaccharide heptosyltransferase II [candidate division Zixibacteria bacterium]|nr:lipopolysaccharide heptosyltransferase II [candidate division Zixibacteria bacterium]
MPDRCVVRAPNWVGDAVMALPFFTSLRRNAGPASHIACLCRPPLASLYRQVPEINEVIELDESLGAHGWSAIRQNARLLRNQHFDAAFCLPTSFGSALMFWLARIPARYGHAADARRFLLTRSLPYGPNGHRPHRAEGYLSLLSLRWTNAVLSRQLRFAPGAEASRQVDALMEGTREHGSIPLLAIGPGAAQPNKMWMLPNFAAIASRWIDELHGQVVLVGAGADSRLCDELAVSCSPREVRNLAGAGDLAIAAEIIRRAQVFLGNDSGLAHLAAAVGTRCVVISGPGDPAEVAPFSPVAVTIRHPVFCSPCYKNSCWREDHPLECLTHISVDDVWRHVVSSAGSSTPESESQQ